MSLTPGTKVGPYEVVGPLGAGGMGEVWRARDPRLGREVAIKGLPAEFAKDPERLARFDREARLLASLSHPNIAAIFGLEDAGGTPYLVLELVDGESLAQRLARGPLAVRETLELGGQVAAAIEAAHERGIVHRDLKPGNVMIGPSRIVKVLDFGLAKGGALEAGSSPDASAMRTIGAPMTGAGFVLGTTSYMSPEQARGMAVDRRTDVWAFGCVLFECLTGARAFDGATASDVIGRVLEREPEWNAIPATVPARLRDVVRRCLTKDADERPRDIGDMRRELAAIDRELSAGGSAPKSGISGPPSLAVLYFENLASDQESEYFCGGITEDILTDLSKLRGLRVASRNAVARYRGAPVDIAKVGAELGVSAVLEGSVRRAGDRVRISAQLINVADGFHLWAERYDRTLEDVFAVQEEIASSIAAALSVALTPSESANLGKDRPNDVRAYDLYLKGRERYNQYKAESFKEALALFQQAIALDPDYALAWAGIGDTYGQMIQWGGADVAELSRLGLEAARRASALNPRLPEAYKAEGLVLRFSGDKEGGRAALLKAIEVNARFSPALINVGVDDFERGNLAGAERYMRRALEVDPQEAFATMWLALLCVFTGRWDEGMALALRVVKLSDNAIYLVASATIRALIHFLRGELDPAEQALRQVSADESIGANLRAYAANIAARRGQKGEARRMLDEVATSKGLGFGPILAAAGTAVRLGDLEFAMRILLRPLTRDLAATAARLDPDLHPLLDLEPLAPRRRDATLIWPLEAPMIDAARFRLFREVRIESGIPERSDLR